MAIDEELTDEQTDDLVSWGDRMDGNYQPPIVTEPRGGPVPTAVEPTHDQIRAMAGLDDAVTAALGHDVTPGHDELHHYWTRGEGLAKWAESPTPWSTLVAHLTRHVGPEKAKVFASKWFKEVFGYWSGSRKGANPVGPG